MSLITPHLYLGDAPNAQDLNFLTSKKVGFIVDCAVEIPTYYPQKFKYLHLKLNDVPSQNIIDSLKLSSDQILQNIKNKVVTFVHCAAGISRSSSVVIYTLMKLHRWDYEKSFKYVKSMHPRTNPNPGFVEQIILIGSGNTDIIPTQHKTETFVEYGDDENKDIHEEPKIGINPKESSLSARGHKGMYARIF
jgi:dual specificity phosphatase 12